MKFEVSALASKEKGKVYNSWADKNVCEIFKVNQDF